MSEPTIRAGIVSAIRGVSEVGKVYDHIPWASTWDVHIDQFRSKIGGIDILRGFTVSMVTQSRSGNVIEAVSNGADIGGYSYQVLGYQAIKESIDSENAFLSVVLNVLDALDGANLSVLTRPRSQLKSYNPEMVGNTLAHVARIEVNNIREAIDCE